MLFQFLSPPYVVLILTKNPAHWRGLVVAYKTITSPPTPNQTNQPQTTPASRRPLAASRLQVASVSRSFFVILPVFLHITPYTMPMPTNKLSFRREVAAFHPTLWALDKLSYCVASAALLAAYMQQASKTLGRDLYQLISVCSLCSTALET